MTHRRLADSPSLYLRQHAHNPVDWWPWSDEALAHARNTDRPIFLSIGYSTCYWCHVMERESFEDPGVAALLNDHFVPIKVDREQRPDLDELYMAATVILTGHGGWPMSLFLDPASLRPFFAGTYWPKEPRPGLPDFPTVLTSMRDVWNTQRDAALSQAEQLALAVREQLADTPTPTEVSSTQVADALGTLLKIFDTQHGGFGPGPKFPQACFLQFLLDVRARADDDATRDAIDLALRKTLDAIALGGLCDHAGGGFHRYCVDPAWTVPHFEKMLYDQAQLLEVFASASRQYADPFYRRTALHTARCLLRDFRLPSGAFASAIDAETAGREGEPYLWTPASARDAIADPDLAAVATRAYALDQAPAFRDPHHPHEPPRHVLRLIARPESIAPGLHLSPAALDDKLDAINASLFAARNQHPQPRRDDARITAWNAMAIAALARAGTLLDEPSLTQAARAAMNALLADARDPSTGTLRRAASPTAPPGVLEDDAAVLDALTALAQSSPNPAPDLAAASSLLAHARRHFADPTGAWYDTPIDRPDLFARARSTHDGATPCALSLLLHALIDLAELTGDRAHTDEALGVLASISGRLSESPVGAINSTRALFRLLLRSEVSAPTRPTLQPHEVVEILAAAERVTIPNDRPAMLEISVRIAPGWHVPAADPGHTDMTLHPFRVGIAHGAGVKVYADYPKGHPIGPAGRQTLAYESDFELRLVLERDGAWSGRPIITVTYQPCSDRACLAPTTVELDIALDPA